MFVQSVASLRHKSTWLSDQQYSLRSPKSCLKSIYYLKSDRIRFYAHHNLWHAHLSGGMYMFRVESPLQQVISCNNHLYFGLVRALTFVSQTFSFTSSTSSWMCFFQKMLNFLRDRWLHTGLFLQTEWCVVWFFHTTSRRCTSSQHSLLSPENHND